MTPGTTFNGTLVGNDWLVGCVISNLTFMSCIQLSLPVPFMIKIFVIDYAFDVISVFLPCIDGNNIVSDTNECN